MRKASAVQELREEVGRLREDGLSFSKVAKRLAIAKSYAVKLSQEDGDRSSESVTGHSTAVNVRQRRFIVGLAEGKTQRQAAVEAGVPAGGADSFAQRTLKDRNFQETFAAMLDRVGLSEERIIRALLESFEATKVVATATRDGRVTHVVEHPDYSVRQRAVQLALDLCGRRRPSEPVEQRPRVELHMNLHEAVLTEQLTGNPILDDETRERVINSEKFKNDPLVKGCWEGPWPSPSAPSTDEDNKGEADPPPWNF